MTLISGTSGLHLVERPGYDVRHLVTFRRCQYQRWAYVIPAGMARPTIDLVL